MPESAEDQKDVPILSRLRAPEGAVRSKKRKGRGPGSGLGKTAGKGQKGQKARSPGNFSKLGFEGGQTPIYRRMPKYGFRNPFSKRWAIVNVGDLAGLDQGAPVDLDVFREAGVLRPKHDYVKVLGNGQLDRAVTVRAHAFSASAKQKIEQAGEKAEVISMKPGGVRQVGDPCGVLGRVLIFGAATFRPGSRAPFHLLGLNDAPHRLAS